jgi:hypothetical protein
METNSKPSDPSITLYRGWTQSGIYTWSPFVTKLELLLRISSITYRTEAGNTRTAPTGKIPYISLTSKSNPSSPPLQIGDSSLIAKHLISTGLMEDLNGNLNETSKAMDLAIQALFEDKLYFYNMRERWIDNFYVQRDKILEALPWLLRVYVGGVIYRSHVKTLHGQGTGRFSNEEVKEFREEIWDRLNGMLGEGKRTREGNGCFWCLGGEEPTGCDVTVFGFICSVLVATR